MNFQRLRIAIVARNRCNVSDLRQAVRTRTYMLLLPVVSHVPLFPWNTPILIVQEVTPQNQSSHWKNLAAAVATPSNYGGFAVTATVLQFALGEERKDRCVAWRRTPPNALTNTPEHQSHSGISSSPENTPALLKHKGFILTRILTSGIRWMSVAFALWQLPSLLGGYKSSPTWNKTQYFW